MCFRKRRHYLATRVGTVISYQESGAVLQDNFVSKHTQRELSRKGKLKMMMLSQSPIFLAGPPDRTVAPTIIIIRIVIHLLLFSLLNNAFRRTSAVMSPGSNEQ
jgi:hypothetical protein